jgi:hypothetical protein
MSGTPTGEDNMNVKKVYNDVIDEEIDLENPEEVPNTQALKNQPVDEVHHVSEDLGAIQVPSPENSENSRCFADFRCSIGKYDGYEHGNGEGRQCLGRLLPLRL